jgi:hypothetical protein
VEFAFPGDVTLAAGGYLIVVHFDPMTEPLRLSAFRAKYGLPASVPVLGPYRGRLNNGGDTLALLKPDPPQMPPHPDAGFVPYVLADRVRYSPDAPWPGAAAGSGSSLQRRNPAEFGNDPVNWIAASPTAGGRNTNVPVTDADGDGLPDDWEVANDLEPALASGDDGAAGDPDRDGLTNLEEYLGGTDPRGFTLRFTSVRAAEGGLQLQFNVASGQAYLVQSCTDLTEGSWVLCANLPVQTIAGRVEILVPISNDNRHMFFRVRSASASD